MSDMDNKNEISTKSKKTLYDDNIPGWLVTIIFTTAGITIIDIIVALKTTYQSLWLFFSFLICITICCVSASLYVLFKNIKFWSFNKGVVGIIIYVIGVLISIGLYYCVCTEIAAFIVLAMMFLLLIPAYIVPNKMHAFIYSKNRIHNEFRFKAQNFIRPNRDNNSDYIELANKNCIVRLYESNNSFILYCDKTGQNACAASIGDKADSIKLFAMLSKFFNFDTEISDITNIIYGVNQTISIENIKEDTIINETVKIKNINASTILEDLQKPSINNMSVAELICLPGINMGKAYKINKYLQDNEFGNYDEFMDFAQISKEDATEIREAFKNEIRYIYKNKELEE